MTRTFPGVPFERYVDDAVVHCASEREALAVRAAIGQRMEQVGLTLHPTKTKIVYCKDSNRAGGYRHIAFNFLGYAFRPRQARNKQGRSFTAFLPAMSQNKLTEKGREVRKWGLHWRVNDTLTDLAKAINPIVRGWMNYWGHFYRSQMYALLRRINSYLMRWARKKYKRLGRKRAQAWWDRVTTIAPGLFAHWKWTRAPSLTAGW